MTTIQIASSDRPARLSLNDSRVDPAAPENPNDIYADGPEEDGDVGSIRSLSWPKKTGQHLWGELDPKKATLPLVWYCFMTGYIDAIAFSACFIWCAFQTGNTIQLSIALARLFSGPSPRDTSLRTGDAQAMTSLLTFLLGSFIGRIGDRVGVRRRSWLVGATFAQALFTLAACLVIRQSPVRGPIAVSRANALWTDVYGFVALGFLSMSMGLQSLVAKRLNTTINTSVVLTTIWTELVAEPSLFKYSKPSKARDHRAWSIGALFLGGVVGRAIAAEAGAPVALAVGAAMRAILSLGWIAVPDKVST